ncbi:YHS domain-containing (seleno)protein [Parvularcula sp. LCG005]|uniref:YHS domain-containing (seleno)protein n=1 Tax=Parvularcula sp. LCG005 TaxID=3078805 RepID=UPI002942249B|nr:YHS domain-containing (seleno)protein [Parvularcula sp. LCG005]WOI54087.1 YHS domain-containing (seleno)protein [Parvularcula sp. LCG005]
MIHKTLLAFIAALFITAPAAAMAAKPPIYTGVLSNVALGEYDAVSFFDGAPKKGSASFKSTWNGADWYFVSAANKARFDADPQAFAPQYGGYCAWAVGQGYLAKGDPRYSTIVAGKLYLNFNDDVLSKWKDDIPGNIRAADANWPDVLDR